MSGVGDVLGGLGCLVEGLLDGGFGIGLGEVGGGVEGLELGDGEFVGEGEFGGCYGGSFMRCL